MTAVRALQDLLDVNLVVDSIHRERRRRDRALPATGSRPRRDLIVTLRHRAINAWREAHDERPATREGDSDVATGCRRATDGTAIGGFLLYLGWMCSAAWSPDCETQRERDHADLLDFAGVSWSCLLRVAGSDGERPSH